MNYPKKPAGCCPDCYVPACYKPSLVQPKSTVAKIKWRRANAIKHIKVHPTVHKHYKFSSYITYFLYI